MHVIVKKILRFLSLYTPVVTKQQQQQQQNGKINRLTKNVFQKVVKHRHIVHLISISKRVFKIECKSIILVYHICKHRAGVSRATSARIYHQMFFPAIICK